MKRGRKLGLGVLVAVGVLLVCEIGLRLIGPPPEPALVVRMPDGSTENFTETADGLVPNYQGPFTVPAVPLEASGPRVLMFGGSSVHGGGADRLSLQQEAPGVLGRLLRVDVQNLGAPGLDSGHLVSVIEDALVLEPDVVVIYTGHNDLGNAVFFHRYGDSRSVWTYKARSVLGRLAMFQVLDTTLAPREFAVPTPELQGKWTVDADQRLRIRDGFESRLRRMIRSSRAAGAEVVVATVASNAWEPSLDWTCPETLERLGLRAHGHSVDWSGVDPKAVAAEYEDSDCPDVAWLHGLKNNALDALDDARDRDPLPLRADRETVELIRTVAAEEGAHLADVAAGLRAKGQGIEPRELYADSVHYAIPGHEAVAEILAPVVDDALKIR
ncbi:MAG: SGNH/GDSL hydrolase family protein [Proteobacteria bacterium]|nr:SGNH/GDSL hydrolase family protein [Pseudomonadota bacterium]MCP4919319.1 SGNH/GDSL hydrolase family protein [Pseudomonadota bacterium]